MFVYEHTELMIKNRLILLGFIIGNFKVCFLNNSEHIGRVFEIDA